MPTFNIEGGIKPKWQFIGQLVELALHISSIVTNAQRHGCLLPTYTLDGVFRPNAKTR